MENTSRRLIKNNDLILQLNAESISAISEIDSEIAFFLFLWKIFVIYISCHAQIIFRFMRAWWRTNLSLILSRKD